MTATEPPPDLYAALLENILDAALNGRPREVQRYLALAKNPKELAKLLEDEPEEEVDEAANYQLAESVLRDWEAAHYAAFDPAKHPRGQPENAGQFGTGGGSAGATEKERAVVEANAAPEPAAPVDDDDDDEEESELVRKAKYDYQLNGVTSEAFKAWFGDWETDPANASKVLNADGEPEESYPIPVYHGTRESFDRFSHSHLGSNTGAESAKLGFFFTNDREVAADYYNTEDAENEEEGKIIDVYLNIRNPLVYDFEGEQYRDVTYAKLIAKAKRDGNDGVIFRNTYDSPIQQIASTIYVAFEPTQIKSVANAGSFNPEDPRIGYALEPYIGPRGGKGERDTVTGRVRYTTTPSGERSMGRPRPRLVDPGKDDKSTYWLADWYCRHWNTLIELGWPVPPEELEAAEQELQGGDTAVWLDPETEEWETVPLEVKEEGQTRYERDPEPKADPGPSLSDTQVYLRALAASPAALTEEAKNLLAKRLQEHSPADLESLKSDVEAVGKQDVSLPPIVPVESVPAEILAAEPPARVKKVRNIIRDEHGDIIRTEESEEPI